MNGACMLACVAQVEDLQKLLVATTALGAAQNQSLLMALARNVVARAGLLIDLDFIPPKLYELE